MKIINKPLTEIRPYESNPRINDGAIAAVTNSIREFGFRVPIIISADNEIVAGHTRYAAAKALNFDTVPCIVAEDLSQDKIRAFRIVDNKTAELSEWDFEKLRKELSELDFDFTEFGFENFTETVREELENTTQELSVDDYSDNNFECECPRCGFKFNR